MSQRRRPRLTYANVVATLALFGVVAGGTAIALPGKHSVTANDLHKNAVRAAAIATGAVTSPKIKDGTVGAADLADGGITGAKVADLSLGYQDLGSNSVVARIRSVGSTSTGDGGQGNPVSMSLTGNTWTQAVNETDVFFGQMTVTQPPLCGGNGIARLELAFDGNEIGHSFFGDNANPNTTETGFFLSSRPYLFEPGSATPRTASIRVSDNCTGAGQNYTINDVKVDAVAIR